MNTDSLKTSCLLLCVILTSCVSTSIFSTPWSDNVARDSYGTKGSHPALNDGKLDTIATTNAEHRERIFTLTFPEEKPVRKIVIHNQNLFWFDIESWNAQKNTWETVHIIRDRRDAQSRDPHRGQREAQNQRAQPRYVIDRLNFKTSIIRINVARTVDDDVVPKPVAEPNDIILNRVILTAGPHFRVLVPSQAEIREIEVYHLQSAS